MGVVYVLLYLVASAAFTNWVLTNTFSRCENPHYQIQAYNPILFVLCLMFGWFTGIILFFCVIGLMIIEGKTLDEVFHSLAKRVESDDE